MAREVLRAIDIPASTPKPKRFASPGLRRLIVRLGLAHSAEIETFEQGAGSMKLIAALAAAKRGVEAEILAKISADLSVPTSQCDRSENWIVPASENGEFDQSFAVALRAVPLQVSESEVTVALADPLDLEAISEIEFRTARRVRVVMAAEGLILRAISVFYNQADAETAAKSLAGSQSINLEELGIRLGEEGVGHDRAPIIKLVNQIMSDALHARASDVHLLPTANCLEIRFRVDGVMSQHSTIPKLLQPPVTARLKLLAGMDITEKRRPQDGRFQIQVAHQGARDIRASAVPTPHGEKLVFRIQGGGDQKARFEDLGIPESLALQLRKDLASTEQLLLVVGPTGSGKTTTLYAALRHLNDGTHTIVTVEDPVEAKIDGLTQIQVDQKTGVTFATGLRSILRQDPDIVFIGEIRDLETAETAFQAAQTGHLVLSTLHTNDAPATVTRLVDLGVAPFVVADSLRGILAQRLVRKLCSCSVAADEEENNQFQKRFGKPATLRKAAGCERCDQSGYTGRIGVYSYLRFDEPVRELIRRRASTTEVASAARRGGYQELALSGLDLVASGQTTLDEIERCVGTGSVEMHEVRVEAPIVTDGLVATSLSADETAQGSIAALAASRSEVDVTEDRKARILLVDDDKGVRAVLMQVLKKEGFDVMEARDGKHALDVALQSGPDIVVCDLMMPGLSGLGFLVEFRRSESFAGTPVLMLTGSDDERNEVKLFEAGADDFVSKSSSPGVVVARIKRLLGRASLRP